MGGCPGGGWMMRHQKGELKSPGMEMKLEDDLYEKVALMLEYDEVIGLVEHWSSVKGL